MNSNLSEEQTHRISNPDTLYNPIPNGYSHIAVTNPNHTQIYVAGQGGENREGNFEPDFRAQVQQAFKNLRLALQSEQCDISSIVKLTTLIVDYDAPKHRILTEEINRHWPNKKFPVQTLIPVPRLALDEMLFEVEAVAVKPIANINKDL